MFKNKDIANLHFVNGTESVNVNILFSLKNYYYFTDDIFKRIFVNVNVRISIIILLKFVPKGPIDLKAALVQAMAWRRMGNKTLPEPRLTQFTDAYMRHKGGCVRYFSWYGSH